MNTKYVVLSSALFLGLMGVVLTFMPGELLIYFDLDSNKIVQIALQLLGGLYFGFGMLNWMSKASLIGGIYNRPVVIANLSHFMIGGLALIKGFLDSNGWPIPLIILTFIYVIYAVFFGVLLFRHPIPEKELSNE